MHQIADNEVHAAAWTAIEPAVAIFAVCCPSFRMLHRNTKNEPAEIESGTSATELCLHTNVQGEKP